MTHVQESNVPELGMQGTHVGDAWIWRGSKGSMTPGSGRSHRGRVSGDNSRSSRYGEEDGLVVRYTLNTYLLTKGLDTEVKGYLIVLANNKYSIIYTQGPHHYETE